MRRMYKDYSDTAAPSYSSYEPSYSASAYHHRSYNGPLQQHGAASNTHQQLHVAESQQQPQQQPFAPAHELAFRGYAPQHQAAVAASAQQQQQQASQQVAYAQ